MPTFCRHGRLEATCPICSRKARTGQAAEPRRATPRPARSSSGRSPSPRGGDLRVRRMARAADDGYEHELLPGLRSSLDAARLADEIAFAAARLDELAGRSARPLRRGGACLRRRGGARGWPSSSPYLSPLEGDDPWASIAVARTSWASGELPMLEDIALGPRAAHDPARGASTLLAYRAWAQRAGSQAAGLRRRPRVARPAPLRPRLRAPVAARLRPRPALRAAGRPRAPRGLRRPPVVAAARRATRSTRPSSPPSACSASATRCCCSAGRPSSSRPSACPIEALDLGLTNWSRPEGERITAGATVGEVGPTLPRREAIRAALRVETV